MLHTVDYLDGTYSNVSRTPSRHKVVLTEHRRVLTHVAVFAKVFVSCQLVAVVVVEILYWYKPS